MPSKSKNSAAPTKPARAKRGASVGRPMKAATLAEARRWASEYQVIVAQEDGHWYGRGLELPQVMGDGPTAERCIEATREALATAVGYLLETGRRPPTPARERQRTTQVNVRFTAEEKALLEAASRRKGFQSLSEFIRTAAVEATT